MLTGFISGCLNKKHVKNKFESITISLDNFSTDLTSQ